MKSEHRGIRWRMGKQRAAISEEAIQRGSRIRVARTNAELSQARLAELIGVSNPMIVAYEKGRTKIDTDRLEAIAGATGASMSWLLYGDDPDERRKAQTEDELRILELLRGLQAEKHTAFLDTVEAIRNVLKKP